MNDNMNVLAAYEWAAARTAAFAAAGINTESRRFGRALDAQCLERFGIYPPARPIGEWADGPREAIMQGLKGARGCVRVLTTVHGTSLLPIDARSCASLYGKHTPQRIQRKLTRVQFRIARAPYLF